jgi:hypothetical protein
LLRHPQAGALPQVDMLRTSLSLPRFEQADLIVLRDARSSKSLLLVRGFF